MRNGLFICLIFTVTEDSNADFSQGDVSAFVDVVGDTVKLDTPTWTFSDDICQIGKQIGHYLVQLQRV